MSKRSYNFPTLAAGVSLPGDSVTVTIPQTAPDTRCVVFDVPTKLNVSASIRLGSLPALLEAIIWDVFDRLGVGSRAVN